LWRRIGLEGDEAGLGAAEGNLAAVLGGAPAGVPIHGEADVVAGEDGAGDLPVAGVVFADGEGGAGGIDEGLVEGVEGFFVTVLGEFGGLDEVGITTEG
jgi:hypothetical protein